MSTANKLNRLLSTKENIRLAIIDKGVNVSTSDTFASYPSKINQISGGGGIDWTAIGYDGQPQFITDGYNYAKTIYDGWDSSITSINRRWKDDDNLVYFPKVDVSNVIGVVQAFYEANSLEYVPDIEFTNLLTASTMFYNCTSLHTCLAKFPALTQGSSMFSGCESLEEIPDIDMSKMTNIANMFSNCKSLRGTITVYLNNAGLYAGCLYNTEHLEGCIIDGSKVTDSSHNWSLSTLFTNNGGGGSEIGLSFKNLKTLTCTDCSKTDLWQVYDMPKIEFLTLTNLGKKSNFWSISFGNVITNEGDIISKTIEQLYDRKANGLPNVYFEISYNIEWQSAWTTALNAKGYIQM